MEIINKKVELALIDGVSAMNVDKLKTIIKDINLDVSIKNSDLFLLGFELGKLYVFEVETTTYGNGFDSELYSLIGRIACLLETRSY
jgi:hypothetical protein